MNNLVFETLKANKEGVDNPLSVASETSLIHTAHKVVN